MPIYEFHCFKCEENFETLVMSGSESISCPHCHSKKLERLMSGFSRAGQGGGEDNWDSYGGDSGGDDSYGGGGGCAGCAGGACSSCH